MREGKQSVRETSKYKKSDSFIFEEAPVREMITFQVRFNGKTPYVHLGVNFDDNVLQKTAFNPQALTLGTPTATPPFLQRSFYYPIYNHSLSTDVDFIYMAALDDLISEFSGNEVPVVPLEMKSAKFNQGNNMD